MNNARPTNVAASIHQRLLNLANRESRPFNDVLQFYGLERWLLRLSRSAFADRFVLKGALMLTVWKLPVTRPTRDIDLLGRIDNDLEGVRAAISTICATQVDDDGVVFNAASVKTETIAEEADYQGVRATFEGHLGKAIIPMQIDIGFSDVLSPGPVQIAYPTLLDMPVIVMAGYNRETAIAEKVEAMIKLGELNSRMKDFYDVWILSSAAAFDGGQLTKALHATCSQRGTSIRSAPICLSDNFASSPAKQAQWTAFVRRFRNPHVPTQFVDVIRQLRVFLLPLLSGEAHGQQWTVSGPWQ
jgi:hypothetical protein